MKSKALIEFIGRLTGAIGLPWKQTKEVEFEYDFPNESPREKAILKLYETHEHISVIRIRRIP